MSIRIIMLRAWNVSRAWQPSEPTGSKATPPYLWTDSIQSTDHIKWLRGCNNGHTHHNEDLRILRIITWNVSRAWQPSEPTGSKAAAASSSEKLSPEEEEPSEIEELEIPVKKGYIYIYIYIYIYVYTYRYVFMYVYICMYVRVNRRCVEFGEAEPRWRETIWNRRIGNVCAGPSLPF